jgi:hypothetical protein
MNLIKAQLIKFLNKYNALFSWLFLDNWNLANNQNHLNPNFKPKLKAAVYLANKKYSINKLLLHFKFQQLVLL